jgi:hypothetical protein
VALAVAVPVLVFLAPNEAFSVFDKAPIKALISILLLAILAVGCILVRVLTSETSAERVALRAWQASLAFVTATMSQPFVPFHAISAERLGLQVTFTESLRPSIETLVVAFSVLFIFTSLYVFVRWISRQIGPF